MARQPFNDFLNSPGPSTPRGRGGFRGRGRGGGGDGSSPGSYRGGGGRGGAHTPMKSFKTDYSNVPFDYTAVNQQKYTKMDGFAVSPHGATTSTDPPSGSFRGRGRGRGGGPGGAGAGAGSPFPGRGRGRSAGLGFGRPNTPSQQDSPGPSGTATPVTGLGYKKDKNRSIPESAPVPAPATVAQGRTVSTVGRGIGTGEVVWGGRKGAPMFVKAGELFKDGEVDVITHDQDKAIEVDSLPPPLSDRSALQNTDLQNEIEIEIPPPEPRQAASAIRPGRDALSSELAGLVLVDTVGDSGGSPQESREKLNINVSNDVHTSDHLAIANPKERTLSPSPDVQVQGADSTSNAEDMAVEIDDAAEIETEDTGDLPELILDVTPQPIFASSETLYTSHLFAPVGAQDSSKQQSDDEEIIFQPRQYKQPQPINVKVSTAPARVAEVSRSANHPAGPISAPAPAAAATSSKPDQIQSSPIRAFIDPRARKPPVPRKDKKAAKKEQKKARGKQAKRREDFGVEDDIDWGSDGPPAGSKHIEGLEEEEDMAGRGEGDLDMAILRDYLEGTRLSREPEKEDEHEKQNVPEERAGLGIDSSKKTKGQGAAKRLADKGKAKEQEEVLLQKGRKKKLRTAPGWDDPPAARVLAADGPDSDGDGDDDMEGDWVDEEEDDPEDDGGVRHVNEGERTLQEEQASISDGLDDSSELGDLQAIMDALESDEGSETDEAVDEDELFNGKNTWTSEDEGDWFIRNMEEALNDGPSTFGLGKKKGKNVLYKSIQDDDFEMDLPTEPAKKGKKKAQVQGIPEALQAQWETDRQKKAFKKEQRQLERLIAEIEGSTAGGKFSRRKTKGSSKAQQASLAHLIPASASEVADMFDIDSEDEDAFGVPSGGRGMSKMRKMLNLPPMLSGPGGGGENSMEAIVSRVRGFVDDPGKTTLALQPMEKEGRQRMHLLAECFGLKSNSKGKGKARFTIMIKTSRTGLYVDETRVERLISASTFTGGQFYKSLYSGRGGGGGGKGKGGGEKGGKKGPSDRGSSVRAKEGDLVGEGAEKIGEGNMGHKLLSKMGWAEGGRIGRAEGGLTNPIIAVVKNTKSGLGA